VRIAGSGTSDTDVDHAAGLCVAVADWTVCGLRSEPATAVDDDLGKSVPCSSRYGVNRYERHEPLVNMSGLHCMPATFRKGRPGGMLTKRGGGATARGE
jgi:hypothetical protein